MLIIRIAGMASNIYISSRLGASSMGIYHMIFSVFTFGITFAASGTGFAVTRLVSEGRANEKSIIRRSLAVSSVCSLFAFCIFFFASPLICERFIHSRDTAKAMRILAFALPCMGASSVYRGYFIAKRKAVIITISSLLEEAVCILTAIVLVGKVDAKSSYMCLVWGCCASNVCAFVFDTVSAKICMNKGPSITRRASFRGILGICVPIALGSYLRTALVALENLMIPMQFEAFGVRDAIGEYGVIKAMAMPILLFPTVLIGAFSSMLVPEMSEMNSKGRVMGIRHVAQMSFSTTTMFAFFIALMLFKHHRVIAESFFNDPRASAYLFMVSLLAVPMYLDTVADSILKGLNLQNASLRYNIFDSALRIAFIFAFLPRIGPVCYIAMLYLSEIFNLTLSIGKASRTAGIKLNIYELLIVPLLSAVMAFCFASPVVQTIVYVSLYLVFSRNNKGLFSVHRNKFLRHAKRGPLFKSSRLL